MSAGALSSYVFNRFPYFLALVNSVASVEHPLQHLSLHQRPLLMCVLFAVICFSMFVILYSGHGCRRDASSSSPFPFVCVHDSA